MLKIIRNISLLFVLVIMANWILFEVMTRKYYYHPEWKEKQTIYHHNPGYTAVILGSSRTFYCINPAILNARSLHRDSFFNMGVPFLTFPNSYLYAQEIIESAHPPKLILIELSYYPNADLQQLHSAYEIYIEGKKRNYLPTVKNPYLNHLQSYIEPLLNFNWPKYLRRNGLSSQTMDGFISLDSLAKTDKTAAFNHQKFLESKDLSSNQNDPNRITDSELSKTESRELWMLVQSLLARTKNTKTEILFFMPNRISATELGIVYPVYRQIPEWAKLNPTATDTGKTLIQARYSWDLGHLNKAGADIYSYLFIDLLNSKQSINH